MAPMTAQSFGVLLQTGKVLAKLSWCFRHNYMEDILKWEFLMGAWPAPTGRVTGENM